MHSIQVVRLMWNTIPHKQKYHQVVKIRWYFVMKYCNVFTFFVYMRLRRCSLICKIYADIMCRDSFDGDTKQCKFSYSSISTSFSLKCCDSKHIPQSPPIICHAPTASRREATRSCLTRWRPRLGENGKCWISKFSLNNITQILLHIMDYNIWNSFSLTDMRLFPVRNNTMLHLLAAVIWWPFSRCICRCLLIGGKLNSIKFLWRYLMSWINVNDT